ncbi:MAG: hypothetical protein AB7I27_16800 [Bacteriovoracaceae bacterium]
MDNKDFLSFLVDETLKLQKSGEAQLSSFELKLNDYGLIFLKGEFIPQFQILRFKTPFGVLDTPVNWPLFSLSNVFSYSLIDEVSDQDHFLEVMKANWNSSMDKLLITHADGFCYLVGLKQGEDSYLHDLVHHQEWLKSA